MSDFSFFSSTNTRRGLGAMLGLTVLISTACGGANGTTRSGGAEKGSAVGQSMPDLLLNPLGPGTPLRLGGLKGKVVLLDVWASWCAPCKEELPLLDDMAVRLRGKGIEIVGVSIDDNRDDAEQFLRSRSSWSLRLAHDPDGKIPARLQPPKMPTSYVIDRKGIIRQVNAGFERADAKRIEARLLELASAK